MLGRDVLIGMGHLQKTGSVPTKRPNIIDVWVIKDNVGNVGGVDEVGTNDSQAGGHADEEGGHDQSGQVFVFSLERGKYALRLTAADRTRRASTTLQTATKVLQNETKDCLRKVVFC